MKNTGREPHYSIALQKQAELIEFMQSSAGHRIAKEFFGYTGEDTTDWADLCAFLLKTAEPFFWSKELVNLLEISSTEEVDEYQLNAKDILTSNGYCWFNRPVELAPINNSWEEVKTLATGFVWGCSKQDIENDKIYVSNDKNNDPSSSIGLTLYLFGFVKTTLGMLHVPLRQIQWDFGATYYDAFSRKGEELSLWRKQIGRLIISSFLLMNQRIFISRKQDARWHVRADAEKSFNQVEHVPQVNVIELRRPSNVPKKPTEAEQIDWQHRWFVSGHWRSQFYPSEGRNKPIWISTYVKGPEDKPLKAKVDRLFAVVR